MKKIYAFLIICIFSIHASAMKRSIDDDNLNDLILFEAKQLILISADNGDLTTLSSLVDHFPDLVNIESQCGSTPLYLATERNHVACIEYLLAKGAENQTHYACLEDTQVQEPVDKGNTALYLAAEWGLKESLELLVKKFTNDINERSPHGATPLFAAVEGNYPECVKILLDTGADKNIPFVDEQGSILPLKIAQKNNYADIIKLLQQ